MKGRGQAVGVDDASDRFEIPARACRAASGLGRVVDRALADGPLPPAGYRLLGHLTTGGDSAAAELAEKLLVSRPVVTATVDWLESRGLVTRSPDLSDKRKVVLAVTDQGRVALEAADDLVGDGIMKVISNLSHSKARAIAKALENLHSALDEDRRQRHRRMLEGSG